MSDIGDMFDMGDMGDMNDMRVRCPTHVHTKLP